MKKIILCIFWVVLFVAATVFSAGATGKRASLFIGDDEWEQDSLLPFIETEGKKLVPAEAFGEFEGVSIELSEMLGSLLIKGEDKYLSYNLNFGSCIDENGNVTKTNIYSYGGEIYLDPALVCEKFSLKFETEFASDGYLAARISDGSEQMTFSELLSIYTQGAGQELPFLYNPEGKTVEGRFVYPFIQLPAASNIGAIVSLASERKLTFALPPSEIDTYADTIPEIYAAGHTVAFYMSEADMEAPDEFKNMMDKANEFLFSFVGKTVRIYICAESYAALPEIDGYFKKVCTMNLVSYDLVNDRVVGITLNDMPAVGKVNFTVASDSSSRARYLAFFRQFNRFEMLRSMPASEATPAE